MVVTLKGLILDGGGTTLPFFCPNCGPSSFQAPIDFGDEVDSVALSGVGVRCNRCGVQSIIQDNLYEFGKHVAERLQSVVLTRAQVRRFLLKSKTVNDVEQFVPAAMAIDPVLGELTAEAAKQPEPKNALMEIGKYILLAGTIATAGLAGLNQAHDLAVKYGYSPPQILGQEIEDVDLKNTDQEEVENEAEGKTDPDRGKEDPEKWPDPIDV